MASANRNAITNKIEGSENPWTGKPSLAMEDAASAAVEASKRAPRPQLYQRAIFARAGAALIVTGICFAAYQAYSTLAGADGPLLLLLPAVVLSAWFGGLVPGLLSTALCALLVNTFGLDSHLDFSNSRAQLELLMFLPIGGFVSYICGSMHAARELAEATISQLAISQERYRLISETVSDYAFSYRFGATPEEDELVWITPSFGRLTGYSSGVDATPIDWARIVHPEDLQLALELMRDLRQGAAGTREYRVINANGAVRWHRVYGRPLQNTAGHVTGCIGGGQDITVRKRMEAAVHESEVRYRTIVETSSEGIWQMDGEWKTTFANRRMAEMLGSTPEEMLGRHLLDFVFPADQAKVREAITQREFGQTGYTERRYRRTDGTEVWCHLGATPLFDSQGNFAGAVGMHSDITESRRHAEALRESEERFRQLANSVPQIVVTANPDGIPDYFNRQWYDFTGLPEGASGPEAWRVIVHPADFDQLLTDWRQACRTQTRFNGECRLRRHDGVYRWYFGQSVPLRNSAGEIERWITTLTDVHDRREEETRQRFLSEVSSVLGESLNFEETLQRMASLAVPHLADWCFVAGNNPDGTSSLLAAAHQDPALAAAYWQRYEKYVLDQNSPGGLPRVLRTGEPLLYPELSEELILGSGLPEEHARLLIEIGYKSAVIVPIKVGEQVRGGLCLAYSDSERRYDTDDLTFAEEIAHRAAVAMENARLYKELQEADRRKDEFLAMLAHELRNPLAAISGASQVMGQLLSDQDKASTEMPRSVLHRQVHHLARLVDDLLDVSRITRGKIELRRSRVCFRECVLNAIEGTNAFVKSRRHQLDLELPPDSIWIHADPARVQQIVSNLVLNAAKYTDPGGHILVTLELEEGEASLRVRDSGAGLKPEIINGIWSLFVQAERTLDRSQGGLGIGLTLVKALTEMHGGRVGVQSEGPGTGSEFMIALPLLEEVAESTPETPTKPYFNGNSTRRVLVVDDNEDAGKTLGQWLELQGHLVWVAHSGADGLRLVREWKPEVVLLDIGMPGMDGYEVAGRLRQWETTNPSRKTRLIAVTGYGQPADRERAIQAGFDAHLTKPVEHDRLKELLG